MKATMPKLPTSHYRALSDLQSGLGDPLYTADQLRARDAEVWALAIEQAASQIPSSWMDELLTGKNGLGKPPYNCPDIERLLLALQARIYALPMPDAANTEGKHG